MIRTFLRRKIHLLSLVFALLSCFSCTRLPDIQGKGEAILQGEWNQDSVANASNLLSYTQYHFKITCDSFYVDLTTHSKVNYYEESCFNGGIWKEYAKGTYAINADTLILTGTFTKENYKQKVSGCYRDGQYLTSFKIKSTSSNQLSLESLNDQRECILNLKRRVVCVQKEL